MKKVPVDDKWSWIACGTCFWTLLFIQGTVRSAGLFYASMVEQWNVNRVEAAWPFNLCVALEGFGMFLTGIVDQRNNVCRGMILAVSLFSLSFALSSLTNNIFVLTVLIGIFGGLCHGYIIATTLICICQFFTRYRNAAMGITLSGSTMGGIFLPYLHRFFIDAYKLDHAFLLVSGASLQAMISVVLCRLVTMKKNERTTLKKPSDEAENLSLKSIEMDESNVTDVQLNSINPQVSNLVTSNERTTFLNTIKNVKKKFVLLKHPVLYIYAISYAIIVFCTWFWYIAIVDIGMDKGLSQFDATSLIPSSSIAALIGRLSYGWIVDFGLIERNNGLILLIFTMALSIFLTPYFINFFILIALTVFFGLSAGGTACGRGSIPAEYFGVNQMSFALGLNGMLCSGASLLRPWIVGYIRDISGSYDAVLYIHGAMMCFAGVLWLMEPFAMKAHNKRQEGTQIVNTDI